MLRLDRITADRTASGQIVNLMSNDVNRLDQVFVFFHFVWIMPIQVIWQRCSSLVNKQTDRWYVVRYNSLRHVECHRARRICGHWSSAASIITFCNSRDLGGWKAEKENCKDHRWQSTIYERIDVRYPCMKQIPWQRTSSLTGCLSITKKEK